MNEYKVVWCRYPFCDNDKWVMFVCAKSPEDAKEIAIDHIERRYGYPQSDFKIFSPELTTPPPEGKVKEGP